MDVTLNPAFIIFAAIAPLLISFIKQKGWSTQINAIIAFACYVVVGVAGVVFSGEELSWQNAVNLVAVTTVVGSAAYGLIWSKLGGDEEGNGSIEDRITTATSFAK